MGSEGEDMVVVVLLPYVVWLVLFNIVLNNIVLFFTVGSEVRHCVCVTTGQLLLFKNRK